MRLTREENKMLDGKYGYPVQKAMEILVGVGESFDAKRMLPITSVHLSGCSLISATRAGAAFVKEMADKGGRFVTFTDTNIRAHDAWIWRELGIPEDFVQEDNALIRNLERMGALLCNTCSPYLVGHVPRVGQHIAWGESSATIFANSVLGARTNRESGPTTIAAALTGRTPAYGFHLNEARYGDLKISVDCKLDGIADYGTLGYYSGKIAGQRVPVFTGMTKSVSWDELKMLGAALATSGSVAMFHIVGVTPNAVTEKLAFGGRKVSPSETHKFGGRELKETEAALSKAKGSKVNLVVFGCPHCSIVEVQEIAQALSARTVKPGTELWVMMSRMIYTYAEKMGYIDIIRAAGAKIVCEVCPVNLPRDLLRQQGIKTAATNSAKLIFYAAANQDISFYYGSTSRCIEAAVHGVWR